MSLSTTFVHGFDVEAIKETDPINGAAAEYWKFGRLTQQFNFGMEQHNWRPNYFANRDPTSLTLAKAAVDNTLAFQPVNGLWWYYFLGSSSTAGADPNAVHTLSGINSGSLPTLTYRWEDKGGSAERFSSLVGNVVESLVYSQNFGNSDLPGVMAINLAGIKQKIPTHPTAHNGPQFPTNTGAMGGTQRDNVYLRDTNFEFDWDSSGDDIDYSSVLEQIQVSGLNLLNKQDLPNQAEREYIFEGNRVISLIFRLKRIIDGSMIDDFNARTLHDINYKIYSSPTTYQQLTFTDVGIQNFRQPHSDMNESPFWQVEATVRLITPAINDGVHFSYYGE